MMQPLSVENFHFLSTEEIADFDLMAVPTHGDTGYIIECDLNYPEKLHKLHTDYPLAPEHLTVSPDMLSDFCSEIKVKIGNPCKHLFSTSWTKSTTFAITVTYNFTSNTVSF